MEYNFMNDTPFCICGESKVVAISRHDTILCNTYKTMEKIYSYAEYNDLHMNDIDIVIDQVFCGVCGLLYHQNSI